MLRDPSTVLIAFVLPGILLFIFGYKVSLDANRVRLGLVLESTTPEALSLAAAIQNSRYFDTHVARDRGGASDLLRDPAQPRGADRDPGDRGRPG